MGKQSLDQVQKDSEVFKWLFLIYNWDFSNYKYLMDSITCKHCYKLYTVSERKPVLLPCGDTIC